MAGDSAATVTSKKLALQPVFLDYEYLLDSLLLLVIEIQEADSSIC